MASKGIGAGFKIDNASNSLTDVSSYLRGVNWSASPERLDSQITHIGIALAGMWLLAWLKPQRLLSMAVPLYLLGVVLLVAVELFGEVSKGAQRWLDLGVARIRCV